MPDYRFYTNAGLTQYIVLTTATDATEVPTVDYDNYTDLQDGTLSDDDRTALRILLQTIALPDGTRPLVTDYADWGTIDVAFVSAIPFELSITGGSSSVGSYVANRIAGAVSTVQTVLGALGKVNTTLSGGQTIIADVASLNVITGDITITTYPADWSGPVLFP